MDTGGTNGSGGFPLGQLPLGFGMALAQNEAAMKGYAGLTETEKEHLILKCKDARSGEEIDKIINSLAPDTTMDKILETESR